MSVSDEPDSAAFAVGEPTVLLVAEGERLAPALAARLSDRGIVVETSSLEDAAATAFVAAPDVVVLAGDASKDGGMELLSQLAANPVTSSMPVVLIADPEHERPASSRFRHGVVGVVDRTASADEMARRIEDLVHELPEREGQAAGRFEETSLDEIVELFAESLRSGVLSVGGDSGPTAQVMVRADRPVRETIAELVERIKPLLAHGETGPLRYEFHESPGARLSSLDVFDEAESDDNPSLKGRRVLLIEQNPARADLLTQHLRADGAIVSVVDGAGTGLELARDLMPEVVLIDGGGVESWARDVLSAIRRDPRLRWASLLLLDSDRLWADRRRPDLSVLTPKIHALVAPDEDLAKRAHARARVLARLDLVGPIRLLRALCGTSLGLRLEVQHPRVRVEVDLTDGLVAGATARATRSGATVTEGLGALATLLGLGSGRVHISKADAPRTANIMSPLDDAVAAASEEEPVVAPSILPPSIPPPPPGASPAIPKPPAPPSEEIALDPQALPNMVRKLEVLLDALSKTEAASAARQRSGQLDASELTSFDDEDDDVTGIYEARLVDRLRKRAIHGAKRAEGPVRVPPPSASIPKPKKPLGKASFPPPAALPPRDLGQRKPLGKPVPLKLGRGDGTDEAATGRDRRRRVRSGKSTLVLGSVAADGTSPPVVEPPGDAPPSELDTVEEAPPGALESSSTRVDVEVPADEPPELEAFYAPAPDGRVITDSGSFEEPMPEPAPAPPPPIEPPPPIAPPPPIEAPPPAAAPVPEPALPAFAPVEPDPFAVTAAPDASLDPLGAPDLPKSKLPLIAAAVVGGVALLSLVGGVVIWALSGDDGDEPVAVGDPLPEDPPVADPPPTEEPAATDEAPDPAPPGTPPPAADPPAVDVSALGPDDPIEGSDDGFDLAAYGVVQVRPPDSRRRQRRMQQQMIRSANRLRRQGDLDGAEEGYVEMLGTFPESTRATAGLARVYLSRGEPARALPLAQRLVRLRPQFASNFLFLGDVFREAGNLDAAQRAYQHAVELEPRWEPPRRRLFALRQGR